MKNKKENYGISFKFIIYTLFITLIIIPISFNVFFLWESGFAKGKTSDWFAFYGNIFGGLISGFFTYIALILSFQRDKKLKKEENSPKIDIPHQNFKFKDSEQLLDPIIIKLYNTGGSIAKNVECRLTIDNFEEVIKEIEKNKNELDVKIKTTQIYQTNSNLKEEYAALFGIDNQSNSIFLGGVTERYPPEFIGTCIPLLLNHNANLEFKLPINLSKWMYYIIKNKDYTNGICKELFKFNLEIRYSSDQYGDFSETFELEWNLNSIVTYDSTFEYNLILESTKIDSE